MEAEQKKQDNKNVRGPLSLNRSACGVGGYRGSVWGEQSELQETFLGSADLLLSLDVHTWIHPDVNRCFLSCPS